MELLAAQSDSVARELEARLDSSALTSQEAQADPAVLLDCQVPASVVAWSAAFAPEPHSYPRTMRSPEPLF